MAVLKNKIELKNVSKVYETRDKQVRSIKQPGPLKCVKRIPCSSWTGPLWKNSSFEYSCKFGETNIRNH